MTKSPSREVGSRRNLQQEIRESGVRKVGFTYDVVSLLPILNAVVTENLKLYLAILVALGFAPALRAERLRERLRKRLCK